MLFARKSSPESCFVSSQYRMTRRSHKFRPRSNWQSTQRIPSDIHTSANCAEAQFLYNIYIQHFKQKHKGTKLIVHANLKAIRRLTPMFSSRLKTINLVTPPRALTVGTIRKYLCKKLAIFSKIDHKLLVSFLSLWCFVVVKLHSSPQWIETGCRYCKVYFWSIEAHFVCTEAQRHNCTEA